MSAIIEKNRLVYPDINALIDVQKQLSILPPLVDPKMINNLSQNLKKTSAKQAFVLHAGDCAERFSDAKESITQKKCNLLLLLKEKIENNLKTPVILIGRMAGQYAKPRTDITTSIDNHLVYSYHGDMINSEKYYSPESRLPDPDRMLRAYVSSKQIMLHLSNIPTPIYTSHECFLLEYEKALTRSIEKVKYNLSTHLPWLGMRNVESEHHINYLAGVANPIGIKVGPLTSLSSLMATLRKINPENKTGKILLVTRLGVTKVKDKLCELIKAISENNLNVTWMCDPLHGNTKSDRYGKKYRLLQDVSEETVNTTKILATHGYHLSGLHLEITPETSVLECISSMNDISEDRPYDSALDPRLNYHQCMDYINQVTKYMV